MLGRARDLARKVAKQHAETGRLAIAVGAGVFVGSTPFYGFHLAIGAALGQLLRLNQLAILLGEQISLPLIAPFLVYVSVQMGHLLLQGDWLSLTSDGFTLETAGIFFADWLVGSVVVGGGLAVVLGALSYATISIVRYRAWALSSATLAQGQGLPAIAEDAETRRGRRWTGRSRGNGIGYAIFFHTVRVLGRRAGYRLLWLVVPYYFLFAWTTRRNLSRYYERLYGPLGYWTRQRYLFRHLFTFARSIVDSLIVAAGQGDSFDYRDDDLPLLESAYAQGKGVILLSAHVGSWSIANHRLPRVPLNLVMFENEAESIRRFLDRIQGGNRPKIISINDGPSAAILVLQALRCGEMVAMHADRCRGDDAIRRPFLGRIAEFPKGPFLIAAISGAPVLITFSAKYGDRSHHCFAVSPPTAPRAESREDRERVVDQLLEAYASALEAYVRKHPAQWYNFYDYWGDGKGALVADAVKSLATPKNGRE
jgi:predicted LPLAT superfamily acyltransferase/uncharacterized protein (DUF2062 family)